MGNRGDTGRAGDVSVLAPFSAMTPLILQRYTPPPPHTHDTTRHVGKDFIKAVRAGDEDAVKTWIDTDKALLQFRNFVGFHEPLTPSGEIMCPPLSPPSVCHCCLCCGADFQLDGGGRMGGLH
jgi:hypothetical protein